jgi:hypothetical protein
MAAASPRKISVFIASPGDLAPERKIFRETITELNKTSVKLANVEFVPIGWEDQNAESGRRVQGVLNQRISECDLFVLVLYGRWGQAASDSPASSYTEEEFQLAMDLWRQGKSPEVIVFFKSISAPWLADPGPQLTRVLEFKKILQDSHNILFRSFSTEIDFGQEIQNHLLDFATGAWEKLDNVAAAVNLPANFKEALDKASQDGAQRLEKVQQEKQKLETVGAKSAEDLSAVIADLSLVKQTQKEYALARAALDAASSHRMEDAKILFAQATENTTDLSVLSAAAEFYRQINDIDNATRIVQRQVSISRDVNLAAEHYLKLVPTGFLAETMSQVFEQTTAQFPPDVQAELKSVAEEVFGEGKLNDILIKMMSSFYTVQEIVQLAAFLASPVGQSSLQKQPQMMIAMMQYGQEEFVRVLRERHPDWFDDAPAASDDSVEMAAQLPSAPPLPGQLGDGQPAQPLSPAAH